MINKVDSNKKRMTRHREGEIYGTAERPRLNVFRSLTNIYAQIIDDIRQNPVSASTGKA